MTHLHVEYSERPSVFDRIAEIKKYKYSGFKSLIIYGDNGVEFAIYNKRGGLEKKTALRSLCLLERFLKERSVGMLKHRGYISLIAKEIHK